MVEGNDTKAKTKDGWDIAAIAASIISAVGIGGLTLLETTYYRSQELHWKEQELAMRSIQQQLQSKGIDVDATLKLLP